ERGPCNQARRRFDACIGSARYLNRNVEGFAGDHVNRISTLLFDLGVGVHMNWVNCWEENTGAKTLNQQQVDVILACDKLQKAIKNLVDIVQFKKMQSQGQLMGTHITCEASTSGGIGPSEPDPEADSPVLFETPKEIKQEPVEIKQEPVEIKQEP
ncbi:hypothetical protein PMAYCL1PPCAC_05037, partial [Pristionchus mayeri]